MFKKLSLFSLSFFFFHLVFSQQTSESAFIKLTDPIYENSSSPTQQKFIIGSTCKSCMLDINDSGVHVYGSGAFVYEARLHEGQNSFTIKANSPSGSSVVKTIQISYSAIKAEEPVRSISIERIQTYPEGDLLLKPGDAISFRVKALTGCAIRVMGNTPLYEMPDSVTKGMKGIYQGKYIVQTTDVFSNKKFSVILTAVDGTTFIKETTSNFSVMTPLVPDVVITKGRLAHLEYGLGDDRLGGAKVGYIDSLIPLKVIGKVGSHYKIKLTSSRTAYIPDELVTEMPIGTFGPSSLTGKIKLYGNAEFDYVKLQLFSRLPYQSFQQTDPSKIVVDVFGATSNTNWIDQLETAEEVKNLEYEQIADDLFRITISLKHHQHWGHRIYYEGNNLIIKIKQQPESLSLKDLTIAIDAGHGGSNTGAGGATGVAEKDITLQLSLKLKRALERLGTNIIMTRVEEQFFDNKERILYYRDSTPDLLLSIHLNSSADPLRVDGTSTFYRYEGFRPLSRSIYKRMLELGLSEYGNNGSFNFMLNSPTEYPNALIETLFLSNPEEEMKILDEDFQEKMVIKIVEGLKDFLNQCKQ